MSTREKRFSSEKSKTVAVVLGAGQGRRMSLDEPKTFVKVAGKPVIGHVLHTLENTPEVDEVMVMTHPDYMEKTEYITSAYDKVVSTLPGGETRNKTTEKALISLKEVLSPSSNILFMDAVRPFQDERMIRESIGMLGIYKAVDTVVDAVDTVVKINPDGTLNSIPDRNELRRGQTPQGFKLDTILKAYQLAAEDPNFEYDKTDDMSVLMQYLPGVDIGTIEGARKNIKLTEPIDLYEADRLFQLKGTEAGEFSDKERYEKLNGKTIVVFGGSYGIGKDIADLGSEYGSRIFSFGRSTTKTDVTKSEDIEKALEQAFDETGRVDYVVNTAGELTMGALEDMTEEEIQRAINVNYFAPANLARLAKPYLDETGGQILLFTSSSYTRGRSDYSLYSSSKAATVNLVQALAEEWTEGGATINCINPERTATPMRTKAFGEEDPETLLTSMEVAETSIDALISGQTGQVFDSRITRRAKP